MIGAHHGVAFFSLVHILKALPELYEGFEHIDKKQLIGNFCSIRLKLKNIAWMVFIKVSIFIKDAYSY